MASSNHHRLLPRKFFLTVLYHDIFDYPLTLKEAFLWETRGKVKSNKKINIECKDGYYFLKGRNKIVSQRLEKEKYSLDKLQIVKKTAKILSQIPTVLFVGVTGSVAMKNSSKQSDIDLMIITRRDSLWMTRLIVYALLYVLGIKIRKPKDKTEKDKLCLNMWLDETDICFSQKNIFTSHEIAQILPLVNKNETYERLLYKNKWISGFWPKVVNIKKISYKKSNFSLGIIEKVAYKIQCQYMKPKKTREVVTPTRAFFHPFDWGEKVIQALDNKIKPTIK